MDLAGASFPDAKAQVAAEVTCEPQTLLRTISWVFRSQPGPGISHSFLTDRTGRGDQRRRETAETERAFCIFFKTEDMPPWEGSGLS
jgi:hypothetical protein